MKTKEALKSLQERFNSYDWSFYEDKQGDKRYRWVGHENEDIVVCVHKCSGVQEPFHKHDFFYFNYTYEGEYESLSQKYQNKITIKKDELYAGQPNAPHALCVHDNGCIIIGVLIKKESFFKIFLPMLLSNTRLFNFFLDASTNNASQEFIHMYIKENSDIRVILQMLVREYAQGSDQALLRSLALTFLLQISRELSAPMSSSLGSKVFSFVSQNLDSATLTKVAKHLSYHPNYLSAQIRKETGLSFSQILQNERMNRAKVMLTQTDLSIENIAYMLGYSSSSNFYKAFKADFKCSPRELTLAL